jgi:class 3 adenylate cyclase
MAYRKIRAPIDRLLFSGRQLLEQGVVELNRELVECGDPETLWQRAGEGLAGLYDLEACAVFVRSGEILESRVVSGELELPRFAVGSPLIAALEEQPGLLSRDVDRGSATAHSVGPFQRAVLDTLGVPLVAPIRGKDQLEGFLALGRKRSNDVYSASDLALIALVADRIASELRRFEQAGQIEAGQLLHERLRRYVPGRLAEQLDRGEELGAATRDVSILFVDIRGFSAHTEDLAPEEVFSTVNRYTELVSAIIHDQGGTVVEFNGDGMMAVFGAPHTIECKEQAAVAAGRAIVARVPELSGATGTLSVGVGVATGSAFVGSVHAADRMIWTALGNTTNLASRLQSLTRDFDAAMIIDEATWQGGGDEVHSFWELGEAPIRGRRATEILYALPRALPA